MVHFANGPDSGDLLRRAEVLPGINKVTIARIRTRVMGGVGVRRSLTDSLSLDIEHDAFNSRLQVDDKLFK